MRRNEKRFAVRSTILFKETRAMPTATLHNCHQAIWQRLKLGSHVWSALENFNNALQQETCRRQTYMLSVRPSQSVPLKIARRTLLGSLSVRSRFVLGSAPSTSVLLKIARSHCPSVHSRFVLGSHRPARPIKNSTSCKGPVWLFKILKGKRDRHRAEPVELSPPPLHRFSALYC